MENKLYLAFYSRLQDKAGVGRTGNEATSTQRDQIIFNFYSGLPDIRQAIIHLCRAHVDILMYIQLYKYMPVYMHVHMYAMMIPTSLSKMYLRPGCHLQTECSVEFENLGPKERLSSRVYLASLFLEPSVCNCQSSISRARQSVEGKHCIECLWYIHSYTQHILNVYGIYTHTHSIY